MVVILHLIIYAKSLAYFASIANRGRSRPCHFCGILAILILTLIMIVPDHVIL